MKKDEKASRKTLSKPSPTVVVDLTCEYQEQSSDSPATFRSLARIPLGPEPKSQMLPDEKNPGKYNSNPVAADADTFIRAASASRFVDSGEDREKVIEEKMTVVIAQDSRRKLGFARFGETIENVLKGIKEFRKGPDSITKNLGIPTISAVSIDSAENIATDEDENRDYASYRKERKRDYEAMTTLPDGRVLTLGSGSDILNFLDGGATFRSTAVIFDPTVNNIERYNMLPFYRNLQQLRDLIGPDTDEGDAEINIEGVAVRPTSDGFLICFFHRGDTNGNGHNAVIEYEYSAWLDALSKSAGTASNDSDVWNGLQARRIVRFKTPSVVTDGKPNGPAFPLTINGALFGYNKNDAVFFIPAGVEAEFVDEQGNHHDGVVTFAGMIRWEGIDLPTGGTCRIFQAPGDPAPGKPSVYGKIEGLAAFNPKGKTAYERSLLGENALVIGVSDVDSEVKPSSMHILDLPLN
jgi:hypothetical protein